MSYEEIEQKVETSYEVDIPTTPQVEHVKILSRAVYHGDELTSLKYVVNCMNPYVSLDVAFDQLEQVRAIVQYLIDNPIHS